MKYFIQFGIPVVSFYTILVYLKICQRLSGCVPTSTKCQVFGQLYGQRFGWLTFTTCFSAQFIAVSGASKPDSALHTWWAAAHIGGYLAISLLFAYLGLINSLQQRIEKDEKLTTESISIKRRVRLINGVGFTSYIMGAIILMGAVYNAN